MTALCERRTPFALDRVSHHLPAFPTLADGLAHVIDCPPWPGFQGHLFQLADASSSLASETACRYRTPRTARLRLRLVIVIVPSGGVMVIVWEAGGLRITLATTQYGRYPSQILPSTAAFESP